MTATETVGRDRVLEGLDAARRAGWARAYDAERRITALEEQLAAAVKDFNQLLAAYDEESARCTRWRRHALTLDPNADPWNPTVLMAEVWKLIDESQQPLTAAAVKLFVRSERPRLVAEAIARLMAYGYITETGKRPKTLRTIRPYPERGTTE